jgi:hypothetical protein
MQSIENLQLIANQSKSKSEFARALNIPINGNGFKKLEKIIVENNLNISHFDKWAWSRKYIILEKVCPVCNIKFQTKTNHKDEKSVCSRACANTFFRSGENNGQYKTGMFVKGSKTRTIYKHICFQYWEYKCAICDWDKVVEVHHIDYNHSNNDVKNLIPLCPNHHKLTEINEFKKEMQIKIDNLIYEKWKPHETTTR